MVARSLQALLLLLAAPAAVHAAIDPLSIGGACCGAAALTAAASLKIVTTGNTCLIERMGKFHRQLDPGWHWTTPILETTSMCGTVREQVMDMPLQQCYTRDKYVTSPHHAAPRRSALSVVNGNPSLSLACTREGHMYSTRKKFLSSTHISTLI